LFVQNRWQLAGLRSSTSKQGLLFWRKEAKNFYVAVAGLSGRARYNSQSFLVLFSKKNRFARATRKKAPPAIRLMPRTAGGLDVRPKHPTCFGTEPLAAPGGGAPGPTGLGGKTQQEKLKVLKNS
jgi:hypothetical protein